MRSPLVERLVADLGYPLVTAETREAIIAAPGPTVLFVTGDPAKNLETDDVAVILPELVAAFPELRPAVVDRTIEQSIRETFDVWPTPSLIFVDRGARIGAVPKVRGWDDYLAAIGAILADTQPAPVH